MDITAHQSMKLIYLQFHTAFQQTIKHASMIQEVYAISQETDKLGAIF
jgi:hypothetical protein